MAKIPGNVCELIHMVFCWVFFSVSVGRSNLISDLLKVLRLPCSRGYLLPVASGASSHHLFIAALRPSALHRKYRTVYQILKTYRIVELPFFSRVLPSCNWENTTRRLFCSHCLLQGSCSSFSFSFFPRTLNQSCVCKRKIGKLQNPLIRRVVAIRFFLWQPGCLKSTLHFHGLVFSLVCCSLLQTLGSTAFGWLIIPSSPAPPNLSTRYFRWLVLQELRGRVSQSESVGCSALGKSAACLSNRFSPESRALFWLGFFLCLFLKVEV